PRLRMNSLFEFALRYCSMLQGTMICPFLWFGSVGLEMQRIFAFTNLPIMLIL
ncbi:hypothetical protein ACJX0J_006485, partial [Zea mays]